MKARNVLWCDRFFSYYGKLSFANRVIESLVNYAVADMDEIRLSHISSEKSKSQVNGIVLTLSAQVRQGTPEEVKTAIHTMRDRIQKEIEYTTGMSLETIRINVTTDVKR